MRKEPSYRADVKVLLTGGLCLGVLGGGLRSDGHLGIKLLLLLRTFTSRKYNITQTYRSSNQIVNTCAIRFQASSLSFSGAFNDVYHNVRFILSYINKIC